jgi:hypothetical protein
VVDKGDVRLWTRGAQDAVALLRGHSSSPPTWLDARQAVVDGEVIALDEHGEPDFALLQARIKGRGAAARAEPVRLRGLRPAPPRRPVRCSTSRSRSVAGLLAAVLRRIRGSG